MRTCVKFTFADKIEGMHERSPVRVNVEPRSISPLSSALFILPLFYLRDYNLRALTSVAKNASNKCLSSKALFVGKKMRRPFGHCAPKL